jgi:homoserine O-acetyltransferase
VSQNPFESSDSVRHSRPLRYVQSATLDQPLELELGGQLASVTVAYETYGQLNAARDNAVLVCHAISGDSHVARHDEKDDPGWWDIAVGPGKPIDTDRYFVICPNLLGGCRGTTGPAASTPPPASPMAAISRPSPSATWSKCSAGCWTPGHPPTAGGRGRFAGRATGAHLGDRHPDCVRGVVALATSARLTSQALAFDVVAATPSCATRTFTAASIMTGPHGPDVGLALARMIGHITYLSREAMTEKFEADRLNRGMSPSSSRSGFPSAPTWAIRAPSSSSALTPIAT